MTGFFLTGLGILTKKIHLCLVDNGGRKLGREWREWPHADLAVFDSAPSTTNVHYQNTLFGLPQMQNNVTTAPFRKRKNSTCTG
jgi:hypothetical protein